MNDKDPVASIDHVCLCTFTKQEMRLSLSKIYDCLGKHRIGPSEPASYRTISVSRTTLAKYGTYGCSLLRNLHSHFRELVQERWPF